eukprot:CAMPEP_0180300094 /NCGR_PEP_ID=MMETSP0988-20121125/22620_1 /TAXON_ID=697907 /ORGANISM="non described non described, Strain CCMP2293" /LENGTH=96 /DNA_ID=CAMNT_0022280259 /DNA_START=324 /DNA_END=611 /DNA_ORIENTATION=-
MCVASENSEKRSALENSEKWRLRSKAAMLFACAARPSSSMTVIRSGDAHVCRSVGAWSWREGMENAEAVASMTANRAKNRAILAILFVEKRPVGFR